MSEILIYGNPTDGFKFIGPFIDADDAASWMEERNVSYDGWWTAKLRGPEEA